MTNMWLGFVAALLWGTAWGSYFAPELRRWIGRRSRRPAPLRVIPPHPAWARRTRARPQGAPPGPTYRASGADIATPPRGTNVIAFPRRPADPGR